MISAASKVPEFMNNAVTFLKNKFKGGAEFISNILGRLSNLLSSFVSSLQSLLTGGKTTLTKGLKAGALAGGLSYGTEKLVPKMVKQKDPYADIFAAGDQYGYDPNSFKI